VLIQIRTQHKFVGNGAAAFLESLTPSQASLLKPFISTYSTFLNDKAGIVDDTIITNITEAAPTYHVVTNAGNYEVDLVYFTEELARFQKENPDKEVSWEVVENTGLIALQGPLASEILQSMNPHHEGKPFNLNTQTFGNARWLTFRDSDGGNVSWSILVARTGYTGEDGFELSIPHPEPLENTTLKVTKAILAAGGENRIKLAGLGARDALRLEAGLCLHGHDINDTTTPIQASLIWIIPKPRRTPEAGFKGASVLYGPKPSTLSPEVRRVGMVLEGKGPAAREGDKVYSDAGCTTEVGSVTSGGPSPTLGKNIAMGYIEKDVGKAEVPCWIKVRGKPRAAKFVKMPFVPTKYFKGTSVNEKK
jgi:aminomethyltransferase